MSIECRLKYRQYGPLDEWNDEQSLPGFDDRLGGGAGPPPSKSWGRSGGLPPPRYVRRPGHQTLVLTPHFALGRVPSWLGLALKIRLGPIWHF